MTLSRHLKPLLIRPCSSSKRIRDQQRSDRQRQALQHAVKVAVVVGEAEEGGETAQLGKSMHTICRDPTSTALTLNPRQRTKVNQTLQRSEEHTSELQSLMRISYAVFCLKKTKNTK